MEQPTTEQPKIKILLMEDYSSFVEFYVGRLQSAGFEVITEDDEDLGVERALKEKPDLVILDISLPKEEDFRFIKEVKKHEELSAMPIIILTDLAGGEDVKSGMEAGASEYLIRKNFTFDEIINKINEVLSKNKKEK